MEVGWVDGLTLVATAGVAVYGFMYRDAFGHRSWLHLLIGSVAAVFFLRTSVGDVLGFAI